MEKIKTISEMAKYCWDDIANCCGQWAEIKDVSPEKIQIHDTYEGKNHILTLKKLEKGLILNMCCRPWDADYRAFDMYSIDAIVQLSLFKKIFYC